MSFMSVISHILHLCKAFRKKDQEYAFTPTKRAKYSQGLRHGDEPPGSPEFIFFLLYTTYACRVTID